MVQFSVMGIGYYRGIAITRTIKPGVMPWGSYAASRFIYADTLAGMKQLIRETLKKES